MYQPLTSLLDAAASGDLQASEELLPLMYDELRRLAAARLARTPPGNTLQPTALVHEAYLKLLGGAPAGWKNRGHFFGAAAQAMRNILVDHARRKAALKRGGGLERADGAEPDFDIDLDEVLSIDEALQRLESVDPRKARIVNLRYFAGLTVEETAAALDLSVGTIEAEWRFIKRWLYVELSR